MSVSLVVIAGPDAGKSFPVPHSDPLVVGRGRTAGAQLSDPHASRSHFQVQMEAGRLIAKDLDSAGGMFVNDARVKAQALRPGDVVRVGATVLRVEAADVADQSTLPPPEARPAPKPAAGAAADDLSGQALAHFQVRALIGRGKNGTVYRAQDTREGREVALKVFNPEMALDEEDLQRFIRAMKTMMPLRHPHLVSVYNAGRSGPSCWVSMELVQGVSLATAVRHAESGGDWRVAFRALLHVARALAYLHGQTILHRNITPPNILLATADGTVKLGDLMTAKAQEGKRARDVTAAGELLGDLRYLSPEQTMGASSGDERGDLYSLGAVGYALLAGRPPLEGKNIVETIMKIRSSPPLPPRSSCPGCPPTFEATVMKLLAKKPEARFQSAAELLTHLGSLAASGI
jgi:serine/threonine protein kinase